MTLSIVAGCGGFSGFFFGGGYLVVLVGCEEEVRRRNQGYG